MSLAHAMILEHWWKMEDVFPDLMKHKATRKNETKEDRAVSWHTSWRSYLENILARKL